MMRVTVIKPRNEILARFIQHFYLLRSAAHEPSHSYVTFPSTTTNVSFFKDAGVRFSHDNRRAICSSEKTAPQAMIVGILSRPMKVHYSGEIDEVTVAFKPLGLNQFIECNYKQLIGGANHDFNPYGRQLKIFLGDLFSLHDAEARRQMLEDFFLKQYRSFEVNKLREAIPLVTDHERATSLAHVANLLHVSHKTLGRTFQRHLGVNPSALRKISRFRRSLKMMLAAKDDARLTRLAYANNYYDQAHFIKEYRQFTGETPRQFLRHLAKIGGPDLIWRFI